MTRRTMHSKTAESTRLTRYVSGTDGSVTQKGGALSLLNPSGRGP